MSERDHIWNPGICTCENKGYSKSIADDTVITCDEIMDAVAKSYVDTSKNCTNKF